MADQRNLGHALGLPVNIICGCDSAGIGILTSERPNYVYGVPLVPPNHDVPSAQINISAFAVAPKGSFGNLGRNAARGPALYNSDFSLFKNFRIAEHRTLQFRAEGFNIFNTPQFTNPVANLNAPTTFGRSTSTTSATVGNQGADRQFQLALRFLF